MRVLAFDPGYERLGVAVIEKQNSKEVLLYSDCIRTSASSTFAERLAELGKAVENLITTWSPTIVALENLYFENNAKTAMNVSAVRGMLLYLAARNNLIAHEYTPLQVKVAVTGNGRSDKGAIALMVPKLVSISREKRLDDELDAIAVGITCLASVRN
ncbi:MAG TPA: crossover junction endodeoxyribonuclease RuvC [Candidatus Paceibacterota bacterium]